MVSNQDPKELEEVSPKYSVSNNLVNAKPPGKYAA